MTVYVDNARYPYGRMIMCHLWADTRDELLAMADRIGMQRKWLQQPPKASWVHFDISLGMKEKALAAGAVLTDRYGPAEHVARLRGNQAMLDTIAALRMKKAAALPPREEGSANSPPVTDGASRRNQPGHISPENHSGTSPAKRPPTCPP
jgi:hypothetical protein